MDDLQFLEPKQQDGGAGAPQRSAAAPRRAEAGYPSNGGGGNYGGGDYEDPGASGDVPEDKIPF